MLLKHYTSNPVASDWRGTAPESRKVFIVAAIVTPTADILNMCLFAAPMVALYAIIIVVAWLVNSNRERGAGAV